VTFAVLDYTVYYTNISSPTYQSGPVWEELYSVKEAYGSLLTPPVTDASAELTPAFWHNLTVLFENDDDVYQTWYARRTRDYSDATCTGTCKTTSICGLRASQSQYNWYTHLPLHLLTHKINHNSGTVSVGINFKRDDLSSAESIHAECEGSAIIPIMAAFSGNGYLAFQKALVARLGEAWLNTTVPDNYTVTGWNLTGS